MYTKRMHKARGVPRAFRTRGKDWVLIPLFLFCFLAFVNSPAWAQVFVGSVTGVVTDPTGAVVPGANVTLTDTSKGYAYKATTDGVGRYVIRQLPPSTYQLKVEAQGFRTSIQEGVVLAVNQASSIDVPLALGATAQSVEVVSASPMLSTQDSAIGQNINRTFINDLPLIGRNVFNLAMLAPGVSQAPGATYGNEGYVTNFVSNGGRNATAEILIDGVTTTTYEANSGITAPLYTPSVDAVQEFKIEQGNLSADVGFSGSTYVNMVLRSGTNAFHGSVWDFVRNDKFMANNWFNNRSGVPIPPRRFNQFGVTVGGPIIKDRTFFFFDYEGVRSKDATTRTAGVPSAAMREGDFGEICPGSGGQFDVDGRCYQVNDAGNFVLDDDGNQIPTEGQLWDPYSAYYSDGSSFHSAIIPFNNMATYTSPGHPNLAGTPYQLAPVPGNVIDPVSYEIFKYYPMPNVNVGTADYNPYDNWIGSGVNTGTNDQFDIRLDHRFSDSDMFYARFSFGVNDYHGFNCYGNALDPCTQGPGSGATRAIVLNYVHSFDPQTVLNLNYGVTRWRTYTRGIHEDFPDFDPVTELGLPEYMRRSEVVASPTFYVYGGYNRPAGQSVGAQAWSVYRNGSEVHHLLATLNHIHGRHEMKFGGEFRVNRMNWFQSGVPGGVFPFYKLATSQYQWWGGGDAMADFLTGIGNGSWGEYDVSPYMSTQSPRYGAFFQDNWRVTDKLTLGLGLRYDLEIPRTERYDRMNWWDLELPLGINPATPQLPAGLPAEAQLQQDFNNLKGGLVFASPYQRNTADVDPNNFGPRVSIAYRITDKTVLRTGYGLFYNPTIWGTAGAGLGGISGFQAVTPWVQSMNNDGYTPWSRVSDPWPGNGPFGLTGSSLGSRTELGNGTSAPIRDLVASAYTQTWSFGIQRELPGSVLVDASYVGTKGTKLNWLEAGHRNYLGSWIETVTPDELSAVRSQVPNPFYGIVTEPTYGLSGPVTGAAQLLVPYPQFTDVNVFNAPWANSNYHAFQLKVDKRFSKGLQFLVTYTNSKSIDDGSLSAWTGWLGGDQGGPTNPNNRRIDRALSQYDIAQIFQVVYVYQLPFGRGRTWGSSWNSVLDAFLGGWQTNGIWRWDTGQPIQLYLDSGVPIPTYGDQRPNLVGTLERNLGSTDDRLGQYFANPEVVERPPQYTLGTAPRLMPNVRKPGTNSASLSVFKEISLNAMREGARLEFRAEAFNALNHPQFCGPDTNFGTGNFGKTFSQCNSPREAQLALKLYW